MRKERDESSRPINLVLLAASFIIFGVFGMIFLTQMDLQPGWAWEGLRDIYPMGMTALEADDLNKDGINEVISFSDIRGTDEPERYTNIQYGGIYCLDGLNGDPLWIREFDGPIKKLFPIMDVNNDNITDYFVTRAAISAEWEIRYGRYEPQIILNSYTNQLIKGTNGNNIPIQVGDNISFTNFYIHDLVSIPNLSDRYEDLLVLECEEYEVTMDNKTWVMTNCNLTSYFINGTKTKSIPIFNGNIYPNSKVPSLELFDYYGQSNILYLDELSLILLNTSTNNFLNPIYNVSLSKPIREYEIVEDLNSDGISEIVTICWDGNITLVNGIDGNELRMFPIPPPMVSARMGDVSLDLINSEEGDGIVYFLVDIQYDYENNSLRDKLTQIYEIDIFTETKIREYRQHGFENRDRVYILHEDLDGDLIDEIIFYQEIETVLGFSEVRRYTILNFINGEQLAVINTEMGSDSIITINDFDGDSRKDFVLSGDDRIIAISSKEPTGLWLSSAFPFGFPLFIFLSTLLGLGIIIAIIWGRKLNYQRKNVKEHKLTIFVNVIAITLMSITFALFLILMNIFNNTLISGSNNTTIVIDFIIVTIAWYGALPITAALYNRFAPQFAFIFVKLRNTFFKISRSYNNEIIVLDMEGRSEIGLKIQVKRIILPLLLSIAVGFYAYNALTPILGLPQTFEVFGSTEFFEFMNGYMLCCVLPMILSFLLFAFFISGNFLLDDAGVVYFRQNKKYRQPGDIEPISIWAQSIIKGIAGISALITFGSFLSTVDFSGFFQGEDFIFMIFGVLVIFVMFGGIPFLTGFSYILLAGEVMEISNDKNVEKLYELMEKNGYDIKPRKITNIYPEGYRMKTIGDKK